MAVVALHLWQTAKTRRSRSGRWCSLLDALTVLFRVSRSLHLVSHLTNRHILVVVIRTEFSDIPRPDVPGVSAVSVYVVRINLLQFVDDLWAGFQCKTHA